MTRSTWISLIAASAVALASAYCANQPAAAPAAEPSKAISNEYIRALKRALREEIRWGVLLEKMRYNRRFQDFDWSTFPDEQRMAKLYTDARFVYPNLDTIEKMRAAGHAEAARQSLEETEQALSEIRRDRQRIVRDLLERVLGVENKDLLNDAEYRGGKMRYDVDAEHTGK